jgi:hypothetical protein
LVSKVARRHRHGAASRLTFREKLEAAMIRIQVLSDLHIEFGELRLPKVDADVAVLAGDIHVGRQAAIWSGTVAERLGIPVVQIAGNHEHYGTLGRPQQHFGRTLDELRAAAATGAGRVVFLERETAIVAGVRFLGCTLWTDFELYGDPGEAMAHAEIGMTDFHTIAYRAGYYDFELNARFDPGLVVEVGGSEFKRRR